MGCLPPLCAVLGGFMAQEALKALTGKFTPLDQWVRFLIFSDIPQFFLSLFLYSSIIIINSFVETNSHNNELTILALTSMLMIEIYDDW